MFLRRRGNGVVRRGTLGVEVVVQVSLAGGRLRDGALLCTRFGG